MVNGIPGPSASAAADADADLGWRPLSFRDRYAILSCKYRSEVGFADAEKRQGMCCFSPADIKIQLRTVKIKFGLQEPPF
jgi:hypothetical protein